MSSKTFQEAFELVEFASTPPSSLPTKETKDPFDLVTRTLCDKISSSSFNALFQNLQLEPLPCTSTGNDNDARLHYSDVLRFILSVFCDEASATALPTDDWTALSSKQIEAIIRTFEMLVAMSILPSIDQGIGVPLEKRVTFVKIWKPFLDASQRIQQLQKTLQIFQRLCDINDGLKIQLISKFLPDFISANEQLIQLNDLLLKDDYESFLKKLPLSVIMKEFLLLYGGFGLGGRKAMAPAWFMTSISKKLSDGLASPKGLSNLLFAFDELGMAFLLSGVF
uniref:Uncharacterized protein n=1 Tax=Panagrolaimus davidi TaxID=227884 RepID=A0A914QUM8_9BILA